MNEFEFEKKLNAMNKYLNRRNVKPEIEMIAGIIEILYANRRRKVERLSGRPIVNKLYLPWKACKFYLRPK